MADKLVLTRDTNMRGQFVLVIIFSALMFGGLSGQANVAGPWKAQIVDAETGKPVEGVVVLAVWYRRYTSPGGSSRWRIL